MEKADFLVSFDAVGCSLMEQQTIDAILECNKELAKYGLALTKQQALALAHTRTHALKESGRIELNGSVVDKLMLAFCDSPYMEKDSYEKTLHELIPLFYGLKNDTWDTLSDDTIIAFLKNAFNNRCHGSVDLVSDEALRLSAHIRSGKSLETFKESEHGIA